MPEPFQLTVAEAAQRSVECADRNQTARAPLDFSSDRGAIPVVFQGGQCEHDVHLELGEKVSLGCHDIVYNGIDIRKFQTFLGPRGCGREFGYWSFRVPCWTFIVGRRECPAVPR